MKINILNTIIVVTLSFSYSFAQQSISPPLKINDLRFGGGLGAEMASIDIDLKNKPSIIDPLDGEFSYKGGHQSNRKFQISPHIELGAFLNDQYYLGLLLSVKFTNAQSSTKSPLTTFHNFLHHYKFKNYVNLSLKFGYKLAPNIVFFGSIGPSFANWRHQTNTFYYDNVTSGSIVDIQSTQSRFKTTGLGLGAGIEYWINKNTTISFHYDFNIYKPKTTNYNFEYIAQIHATTSPYIAFVKRRGNIQKKQQLTHSSIGLRFSYFFSFK